MDFAALKSELQTDPTSRGYAAPIAAGNLAQVERLINAAGGAGADFQRVKVDSGHIRVAISGADWTLLTPVQRSYVEFLLGSAELPGRTGRLVEELIGATGIWSAGAVTLNSRPRLVAILQYAKSLGSRAEELWGETVFVTHQQIDAALKAGV